MTEIKGKEGKMSKYLTSGECPTMSKKAKRPSTKGPVAQYGRMVLCFIDWGNSIEWRLERRQ